MAARAGAQISDSEFIQFHPTALTGMGDPAPLATEALRGAGAYLVDADGHRFMADIHPDGDLAPVMWWPAAYSMHASARGCGLVSTAISWQFERQSFGQSRSTVSHHSCNLRKTQT